jgi:hypothetical protein
VALVCERVWLPPAGISAGDATGDANPTALRAEGGGDTTAAATAGAGGACATKPSSASGRLARWRFKFTGDFKRALTIFNRDLNRAQLTLARVASGACSSSAARLRFASSSAFFRSLQQENAVPGRQIRRLGTAGVHWCLRYAQCDVGARPPATSPPCIFSAVWSSSQAGDLKSRRGGGD